METYQSNLEVIARGKGSPQARYEDDLTWDSGDLDADGYLEYLWRKNEDNRLRSR